MSGLKEEMDGCHHCYCCSHYHGIRKGCDLAKCAFVPRKLLEDAKKEIAKEIANKIVLWIHEMDETVWLPCNEDIENKVEELLKEEKEKPT